MWQEQKTDQGQKKRDNFVKLWTAHMEYRTSVFTEEDFQWDTCFSEYRSQSWLVQRQCSLRLQHQHPETSGFVILGQIHGSAIKHILLECDWKRNLPEDREDVKKRAVFGKNWDFCTCIRTYWIWDGTYVHLCEELENSWFIFAIFSACQLASSLLWFL